MTTNSDETVPVALLTRALDEIYALRTALAYEAAVNACHGEYKTFPKTRRDILANQTERMHAAAQGHVERGYAGVSYLSLRSARGQAEMPHLLTRAMWEAERSAHLWGSA